VFIARLIEDNLGGVTTEHRDYDQHMNQHPSKKEKSDASTERVQQRNGVREHSRTAQLGIQARPSGRYRSEQSWQESQEKEG
jgi:hypothetical protein